MADTLHSDVATRWPLGLSREEAAAFIGVGPTTFDKLVDEGDMPKPIRVPHSRRVVWDVDEVRAAFKSWKEKQAQPANEWDSVGAR